MNPLTELKKRLAPRSRWGITLGPRREFGGLTWSEAEDRRQPQDGALVNDSFIADEPQISALPTASAASNVRSEAQRSKSALALLGRGAQSQSALSNS